MKYELAKQLMHVGFPQGTEARTGDIIPIKEFGYIRVPTLEELIEACGTDRFEDRPLFFSLTYWPRNKLWYAEQRGHQGIGGTSTEAVAKLWLVLKVQFLQKRSKVAGKDNHNE